MRRDQLEYAIRAACQIIGSCEVIVVGSQSILGTFREDQLPADATMSVEIDILPVADDNQETARLADLIEGVAGELSPFEELHGFSIDGVDLETSALPEGWRTRLVRVQNANTAAPSGEPQFTGWCLDKEESVRRQAVRPAGEGPQLRRRAASRQPGRRADHPSWRRGTPYEDDLGRIIPLYVGFRAFRGTSHGVSPDDHIGYGESAPVTRNGSVPGCGFSSGWCPGGGRRRSGPGGNRPVRGAGGVPVVVIRRLPISPVVYIVQGMTGLYEVELEPEVRLWLAGLDDRDFGRVDFSELRFRLLRQQTCVTYWLAPGRRVVSRMRRSSERSGGMVDEHVSYEEIAAARQGSAEYREGYDEARRAFLIGQAVRERRLALGLSQAEAAARAGMSQPALSRLEAGGTVPTIPVLERIALALETELIVAFGSHAA